MQKSPLSLSIAAALVVVVAGCAHPNAPENATRDRDEIAVREQVKKSEIAQNEAEADDQRLLETVPVADAAKAPPPPRTVAAEPMPGTAAGGRELRRAAPMPAEAAVAGVVAQQLATSAPDAEYKQDANTEKYAALTDNPVMRTAETPVSTFSIDVDTGAYSNVRRMIAGGALPPRDAVRAEELINYFDYGYAPPSSLDTPFSVTTEIAPAPWNTKRQLLMVGIKGYEVPAAKIPASNLVLLVDTSGSMQTAEKLPLLKDAFKQLVPQLRRQDRVSIVVYAGSAGLVLPPTAGDEHETIIAAIDALEAGGSTNGGAGIELAYRMAKQAFIANGVNRVLLATDGDFNVGTVDTGALKTLVGERRRDGIALTTLGFGLDNYNDELAEQLADIGDGNHAYIDRPEEARKVLVEEMSATMLTIAKDVKIQLEFNPRVVAEYRLIGYENRALRREDFNNDAIDAGEIGAGHDVTALYELTLVGSDATRIDPLRYGDVATRAVNGPTDEIGFLRLRYKQPDADQSALIEQPLRTSQIATEASPRLRFAAAVAAFADSLRGGTHLDGYSLAQVEALARSSGGNDRFGYQAGFVSLVAQARAIRGDAPTHEVAIAQ